MFQMTGTIKKKIIKKKKIMIKQHVNLLSTT